MTSRRGSAFSKIASCSARPRPEVEPDVDGARLGRARRAPRPPRGRLWTRRATRSPRRMPERSRRALASRVGALVELARTSASGRPRTPPCCLAGAGAAGDAQPDVHGRASRPSAGRPGRSCPSTAPPGRPDRQADRDVVDGAARRVPEHAPALLERRRSRARTGASKRGSGARWQTVRLSTVPRPLLSAHSQSSEGRRGQAIRGVKKLTPQCQADAAAQHPAGGRLPERSRQLGRRHRRADASQASGSSCSSRCAASRRSADARPHAGVPARCTALIRPSS